MIAGCDALISALTPDGALAGTARAISDGVFHGKVLDVIVHPDCRGRGIGAELVRRLHEHPALSECRLVELACVDELVPFYEGFGYERADPEHQRMVRKLPQP